MSEKSIIEKIYDQIVQTLGVSDNQLFSMSMPGTSVSSTEYVYNINEPKPYRIKAKESQLANRLFDPSPLTASDNGRKLSSQYSSALNMLTPKLNTKLYEAKIKLRELLMTPYPYKFDDGYSDKFTLEQVFFKLYNEYIQVKTEKLNIIEKTRIDKTEEDFNRWYSKNADILLLAIREKYSKVLSVFSPGDMDIITAILESSSGREVAEAYRAIDEVKENNPNGGYVYPVTLYPENWAEKLFNSSFTEIDLLESPTAIKQKLSMLKSQVNNIRKQANILSGSLPDEITIKRLNEKLENREAVEKALSSAMDDDLSNAIAGYTDGAVGLATELIDIFLPSGTEVEDSEQVKKLQQEGLTLEADLEKLQKEGSTLESELKNLKNADAKKTKEDEIKNKKAEITQKEDEIKNKKAEITQKEKINGEKAKTETDGINDIVEKLPNVPDTEKIKGLLTKVGEGIKKSQKNQTVLINSTLEFTKAIADFQDTKNQLKISELIKSSAKTLNESLTNIQGEITDLNDKLKISKVVNTPEALEEASVSPKSISEGYTQIMIQSKSSEDKTQDATESNASSSQVSVSTWFGGYSKKQSSASSSMESFSSSKETEIEIGMAVAKVDIQREWFNPGVFLLSQDMYRTATAKISSFNNTNEYLSGLNKPMSDSDYHFSMDIFPCFPVSFLVAKDITIKITDTSSSNAINSEMIEKNSSQGGGFLCFGGSSASSSSSSKSNTNVQTSGKAVTIKFNEPQILGQFLQFIPNDQSQILQDETESSSYVSVEKFVDIFQKMLSEHNEVYNVNTLNMNTENFKN